MIRYMLQCGDGHSFESWFKSASAFEALQAAGQLSCPQCGDSAIVKSLMAPRLHKHSKQDHHASDAADDQRHSTESASPQSSPATSADPSHQTDQRLAAQAGKDRMEGDLAKIRDHVEKNAEYVGGDFTKQARAMHDGDAPARSIYGEAKLEDAKALIDDGVPVLPLPFLPKRKLN
ncbi:hypothetical protein EDD53_1438 [Pacificibacter maritimus]|uniref:DUF1178 family protein n=1 Tax=Pacificibacter maritimus TaxID=762213 RepID=A0A3N4V295_9RHOB|nr:DUF1178 family protein [Pacificibacter maritimus]RPE67034.1 hypothetical protein EDD53_1438 [Pacificibacter maritimus]